jgi:hypothetical protein
MGIFCGGGDYYLSPAVLGSSEILLRICYLEKNETLGGSNKKK